MGIPKFWTQHTPLQAAATPPLDQSESDSDINRDEETQPVDESDESSSEEESGGDVDRHVVSNAIDTVTTEIREGSRHWVEHVERKIVDGRLYDSVPYAGRRGQAQWEVVRHELRYSFAILHEVMQIKQNDQGPHMDGHYREVVFTKTNEWYLRQVWYMLHLIRNRDRRETPDTLYPAQGHNLCIGDIMNHGDAACAREAKSMFSDIFDFWMSKFRQDKLRLEAGLSELTVEQHIESEIDTVISAIEDDESYRLMGQWNADVVLQAYRTNYSDESLRCYTLRLQGVVWKMLAMNIPVYGTYNLTNSAEHRMPEAPWVKLQC